MKLTARGWYFTTSRLEWTSWARTAAGAAACAQQQGDAYFWSLHDFLFDHQKEISRDSLLEKLAGRTESLQGLAGRNSIAASSRTPRWPWWIRDLTFGRENGIRATPTVFVNGKQTRIVAPEQLRTPIRQLSFHFQFVAGTASRRILGCYST